MMRKTWAAFCRRIAAVLTAGVVLLVAALPFLRWYVSPIILVYLFTEVPVALHAVLLVCFRCRGPARKPPATADGCDGSSFFVQLPASEFGLVLLAHLVCMFALLAVNAQILSYNSAWCSRRDWVTADLCGVTNRVSEIFDRHNVTHWLCHGSLLGAARSGNPIAWDHDNDICVMYDDVLKTVEWLRRDNMRVQVFESSMCPVKIVVSGIFGLADNWIDIYAFKAFPLTDAIKRDALLSSPDTWFGKSEGKRLPVQTILGALAILNEKASVMPMMESQALPLARLPFCGREWPVPKNYDLALRYKFGDDWRDQKLPSGLRGLTCRLWLDTDALL
eukprot:TRINITY_DN51226_c0_g1_i1.p1 TRINITY_DN51226_c0_g1~~TRINITY_DN51226_c0_g1_i1.p1  ORF type:complete len:334 (+),score=38.88 TRINITY_DN51226_c0_g1_i1:229-1230(+)